MQQAELTPHETTMRHAASYALRDDRPIMLDYYTASYNRDCKLVKTPTKDTILFKNDQEYTSPLSKVFQIDASAGNHGGKDIVCLSENSIYIIHSNILAK